MANADQESSLAKILKALEIQRIVVIDDELESEPSEGVGVEELIGFVAEGIAKGQQEQLAAILGEDANDIDGPWRDIIRARWEAMDAAGHQDLAGKISQLVGSAKPPNVTAAAQLETLIGPATIAGVKVEEFTPSAWEHVATDICNGATETARLLLLFDLDLQSSGLSQSAGADLLRGAIAAHPVPDDPEARSIYHCLISNHFTVGPEEEQKWTEVAHDHDIQLKAFLPISRDRLAHANDFAEGVRLAAINASHEQLKESVGVISQASAASALRALREMTVWDFDQLVRSSEYEGVWEVDTLFRVLGIFERRERLQKAWGQRQGFTKVTAAMKVLRQIDTGVSSSPSSRIREVRRKELYSGPEINAFHLPLDLGDIFEAAGGKYVLLVQQCDLILRPASADRRAISGALVPIKAASQREPVDSVFRPECPHFAEVQDGQQWCVHFAKAVEVNLDVLDLTVFKPDGAAVLRTSDPCPLDLFVPWHQRHASLVASFAELEKKILAVRTNLAAKVPGNTITGIVEQLLAGFVLSKSVLRPRYQSNHFQFGIKRIDRLALASATDLLDRYHAYRRRVGAEHDFAAGATVAAVPS